jgi:multidrug efflux pump
MGGDNVVFWGPLSWAVIFGLIFATFLTLIMVPVMLLIVMKIKHRRQWKEDLRAGNSTLKSTMAANTVRPGAL